MDDRQMLNSPCVHLAAGGVSAMKPEGLVHLAAPSGQVASPASEVSARPVAWAAPTEQETPLRDLDEDGYPTEELLERVKKWPYDKGHAGLMALVRANWNWADMMFSQDGNKYALSTGGWSGNEDLISALQENTFFWVCCWESSRRGGHYEFEVAE